MKYIALIFLLICFSQFSQAESIPRRMHEVLLSTDLIVEVKIVSHTNSNYTIKIIDLYNSNNFGIKQGDYIKIRKEMNVVSSSDIVHVEHIKQRKSGVAFLNKLESGWSLHKISFVDNNKVTIPFHSEGCQVSGKPAEIKTQFQAYFKEFSLLPSGHVEGKKSSKEVRKSNLPSLLLLQYYQLYRFEEGFDVFDKLDCERTMLNE